jgi:hypothetical protein
VAQTDVPSPPTDAPRRRIPTPALVFATLALTIVGTLIGGIGAEGPAEGILMATRGLYIVTGVVAGSRAFSGALAMLRSARTAAQDQQVAAAVDVLGNAMIAWLVAGIIIRSFLVEARGAGPGPGAL